MSIKTDAFCNQLSMLDAHATPACTQTRARTNPTMAAGVLTTPNTIAAQPATTCRPVAMHMMPTATSVAVSKLVLPKFVNTAILAFSSLILALIVGYGVGVAAAVVPGAAKPGPPPADEPLFSPSAWGRFFGQTINNRYRRRPDSGR